MRGILVLIALLSATAADAVDTRTLTLEYPAGGLSFVHIDTSVGDVEVRGAQVNTVWVQVTVRPPKRWLGSARRAERLMESAEIIPELAGSTLRLRLHPTPRQEAWEASWSVVLPVATGLRLNAGVGNVRVSSLSGDVDVDLGVGDVQVLDVAGDVRADVGVGEVEVSAQRAAFGSVRAGSGVGGATLRTPDGRVTGKGFVAQQVTYDGPGTARLVVNTGVGEIVIVLR